MADDNELAIEYEEDGKFYFYPAMALGHLLSQDLFILNTNWMMGHWPEDAQKSIRLAVICNDLFASGADAEAMQHADVELLYRMYLKDPTYGTSAWCIHKRKKLPQFGFIKRMTEAGWDTNHLISVDRDTLLLPLRHGITDLVY